MLDVRFFSFRFGFFGFVVGVHHRFLLTCLLRALSVWNFQFLKEVLIFITFYGVIRCIGTNLAEM